MDSVSVFNVPPILVAFLAACLRLLSDMTNSVMDYMFYFNVPGMYVAIQFVLSLAASRLAHGNSLESQGLPRAQDADLFEISFAPAMYVLFVASLSLLRDAQRARVGLWRRCRSTNGIVVPVVLQKQVSMIRLILFFRPLFNDWEDHLSVKHFRAED